MFLSCWLFFWWQIADTSDLEDIFEKTQSKQFCLFKWNCLFTFKHCTKLLIYFTRHLLWREHFEKECFDVFPFHVILFLKKSISHKNVLMYILRNGWKWSFPFKSHLNEEFWWNLKLYAKNIKIQHLFISLQEWHLEVWIFISWISTENFV